MTGSTGAGAGGLDGPDPDAVHTRADVAAALTALRLRAGLSIRALATLIDERPATVGGYFSGRHLPVSTRTSVLMTILQACGVAERDLGRWVEAVDRARRSPVPDRPAPKRELDAEPQPADPLPAPYRGLAAYAEDDAALFFGRDALLARLVRATARLADSAPSFDGPALRRALIVTGASGSGKSSLIRAALVPSIRAGRLGDDVTWAAHVTRPSDGVGALTPPRSDADTGSAVRHVLVVDQAEELFTACTPQQRRTYLDRLAELLRADDDGAVAVLAMRADHFAAAAREPLLVDPLQHRCVLVPPLSRTELTDAVLGPAGVVGGGVDEGFVDVLLAELAPRDPGGAAHDPGVLPLISHALLSAWDEDSATLSLTRHRQAGGIGAAVRTTAERVYAELDDAQRATARHLFRRLVSVDDDGVVTRWRFRAPAVSALGDDMPGVVEVIDRFVAGRLLSSDADGVEIAHEALLTAWPRLREWADDDREQLRLHRQLAYAAGEWDAGDRDDSLLLGAARLAATTRWTGDEPLLDELERTYLDRSRAHELLRRSAERTRARHLRFSAAAAVLLAVLAIVFGTIAVVSRHTAASEADAADRARDAALSRRGALEAEGLRTTDPSLAMQLALAAYRIAPTVEARSALLDSTASPTATRLTGAPGIVQVAALSDDLVAIARSDGSVGLWSYPLVGTAPTPVSTVHTHAAADTGSVLVAAGLHGRLLAVTGGDDVVSLWDVSRPAAPRHIRDLQLPRSATVTALAISADTAAGVQVAAGTQTDVARWQVSASEQVTALDALTGFAGTVRALAFDPVTSMIATGGEDGAVRLWSRGEGNAYRLDGRTVVTRRTNFVLSLAFGPDGTTLAIGAKDAVVRLWRVSAGAHGTVTHSPLGDPLAGFQSWVNAIAFSADGRFVAAADSDGTAQVWDTSTHRLASRLPTPTTVTTVTFVHGEAAVVTGQEDGTASLWPLAGGELRDPTSAVFNVGFSRDGRYLVGGGNGKDGRVLLWSTSDPARPVLASTPSAPGVAPPDVWSGSASISASGAMVAAGTGNGSVVLWNVSDAASPRRLGPVLRAGHRLVEGTTFAPDGRVVAAGTDDPAVVLWSLADPNAPRRVATLPVGGDAYFVAFSPDSRYLAAADQDHTVHLWDVADPDHPKALARLGGFSNYAYSVTFSPDGRTIAAGSTDKTVRLWSLDDPRHPTWLATLHGPTSTAYSVSFSPDGTELAVASLDSTIWLWDVRDRRHPVHLATLRAAGGQLFNVAFSPTGHRLAAAGTDPIVRMWQTDPDEVAAGICAEAGTPITRAEWQQYLDGATYRPPCSR